MSNIEAATERFRHYDTKPSGVGSDTEGDRPRDNWTMVPRDARFETFKGAVCLDIRRTVSTKVQLACYKMLKAISVRQG